MLNKIKTLILSLSLLIVPAVPLVAGGVVNADTSQTTIQSGECGGADTLSLSSTNGNNCNIQGNSSLDHVITTAVNVLSIIVGVVAVIMIIIGGFRYIASGGKQESVSGAKNTILYAIIGLIIVALAQVIVRFVLNKTTANS
ncbi:MAG: pilin [Candidatus Saccharimonadales bacterium]|jgi:hypothetical protein